jgi:hypothetical protein
MAPSPKQLRVTTASVPGAPDRVELDLNYGKSGDIGTLRLHDDFADFLDCLRIGFERIVVRRQEPPGAAGKMGSR